MTSSSSSLRVAVMAAVILLAPGCGADGVDEDHETEIISKVELTFTPTDGSEPVVAAFTDPDGDGGMSGVAEPITLGLGLEYTLDVRLLNELADPARDITDEIRAEAEEHQLFILGAGVLGPASTSSSALLSHSYADLESSYGANALGDDLPVGLVNSVVVDAAGSSELRVMLRHLPELNGVAQKRADLAAELAAGQPLPGDVDVDVSFELTVQ